MAAANIPADIDTLLTRLSAARAGYLDELDFDLNARLGSPAGASLAADLLTIDNFVDEIESLLKNGTYGLSALETLIDEVETLLKNGTYGLAALDTDLGTLITSVVPKATDEQDSFLWDTSAYGTAVQDISALFTTPLTGSTRRKYFVWIDVYAMQQDAAAWTILQVRVNAKVQAGTYRLVDGLDTTKTGFPIILIEIPPIAKDVQITFQLNVALAGDATVYYHTVTEVLE